MGLPADYVAKWKDHKTTGPVKPFGPHHLQNRRCPEFVGLCDEAEAKGLRVELTVSRSVLDEGRQEQRRTLHRVQVVRGDVIEVSRKVVDVAVAIRDLREKLP